MRTAIRSKLLCLVFLPLFFAACSDAPEDAGELLSSEEGILRYVPADTPYVFATLEPLPDDVREKLGPATDAIVQGYANMVKAAINQPPEDPAEPQMSAEEKQRAIAIVDELAGMITVDGIPEAGIDRDSKAAIYGVGLLPVLRVTLSDPALFDATVKKWESQAGKEMSVATIDGQSYRYAGDEDARVIVAVIEDQLVATFVPAALTEDLLKSVLGLTPPARSIAGSGTLAALSEKYGYKGYGVGVIDVERIAATFLDDTSGVNSALLALMEHDTSSLSDVCKAEIRSMAGIMPRVVTGYTEITPEHIDGVSVFELRTDLAAGLQSVTAPVPGLGAEQGGLMSFGMSLNLLAARDFYAARLDAIEADPYECELFANLQAGVAQGREMLNQQLPPVVYGFRGFLAVIDDIQGLDIESRQPPTEIDMRFLVATEDAQGLLAMGAMFSPEIASLNLQPDSKPVKLEVPALASMVDAAYVAMSENALALSVGNGNESGLTDMLNASAAEPAPFMSMDMDAARYYGFLGEAMAEGAAGSGEEHSPEMGQAMADMMKTMEQMFSRVSFDIQFTERGIEVPSRMELAE
jgi:hypothetical protein